ncbi:TniQ family protein [Roseateles violae]|uniref:TniQ family protein n=1 Tax=Roseateles violae TaxID=3058042 RepID=A0ABT8DLV5_9BURK|nr:TniQ family protein [Pelomonas sp. PFR6]MDN3919400.1 TniQ family protein [Pelomonas sp. PFR6]
MDHPQVPRFATTLSVVNAWGRAGHFGNARVANERAGFPRHFDHQFGWAADQLSKFAFAGRISGDALMDQHSHLPLQLSIMAANDAVEMRNGMRSADMHKYHQLNQFFAWDPLEAPNLRRCPTCVEEDLARYGVAHWRLHHQWPFTRHCAEHRTPLQQACVRCKKSPFVEKVAIQLAHDDCLLCGHHAHFTPLIDESPVKGPAEAYWSLLDLAFRALKGEALEIRSFDEAALRRRGITMDHVVSKTLTRWNCRSGVELAAKLDIVVQEDNGARKLKNASPLMMKLAVLNCGLEM